LRWIWLDLAVRFCKNGHPDSAPAFSLAQYSLRGTTPWTRGTAPPADGRFVSAARPGRAGNPESQTASGQAPFAQDDRVFTVDSLDRLTQTQYGGTNESG